MTVSDAFDEAFTAEGPPREHAAALVGELERSASVVITRPDPSTTARA